MNCNFCGGRAVLKPSSAHLYGGRDYGPVWECDCGARCGCHKGTNRPLGTLADEDTRNARKAAHACFDRLWKPGKQQRFHRTAAYQWLARRMGLTKGECHIGSFSIDQCREVIGIVAEFFQEAIA